MSRAPLCRDMVGRTARLLRDVVSHGGLVMKKGEVVLLELTWRGMFTIVDPATMTLDGPKRRSISQVRPNAFRLLPKPRFTREQDLDPGEDGKGLPPG